MRRKREPAAPWDALFLRLLGALAVDVGDDVAPSLDQVLQDKPPAAPEVVFPQVDLEAMTATLAVIRAIPQPP